MCGPQNAAAPHATAFQAVLDCRRITDNAARLSCFDAAAADMDKARVAGDIVVIDRAQATAAHRETFGLPVPSLDFITRALKPDDVDRLMGVVRSTRADANGHWTMSLEDGAVWRQIEGILLRPPHVGSKISIRKAAMGSFLMNVDGQPGVKVHRDK
jgi:hypothetical protein